MGPRAAGTAKEDREALLEDAVEVVDRKPQGGRWMLWLPVLVAAAILYALNFHNEFYYQGPQHGHLLPGQSIEEEIPALKQGGGSSTAFLVDSEACRIPALDPWDPQIQKFVSDVPPLECGRGRGPQLVASNESSLFLVEEALPFYNITDVKDVNCCYTPFFRPFDPNHPSDDKVTFERNCTSFIWDVNVGDTEFVRVRCYVDGEKIFEDFHAFVPPKPQVDERCLNITLASPLDEDSLSVLIVGIDAVSRLNMHRRMPKTVAYLKKLGALEMLGYNKVGDNTFPNLVPMQMGVSEGELKDICWHTDKTFFDNCTFLWDEFRDAGYQTAFGEDAPWMGIFNYLKRGFAKQPTDYYPRPFLKTIEDAIGHKQPMNAKLCVGTRMTAEVLLDYVLRFSLTQKNKRSFALFWGVSLTHDLLNYPSLGDDLHVALIRRLYEEGILQRTALIVVSDHGIRWGGIRETYQGRLEERLPMLFLLLPAWFRERYAAAVANVGRNSRRLTSPFDVHETLRDLLRPSTRLTQAAVRERSRAVANSKTRDISLFLQIPQNRTCSEAGISPHWCTCQTNLPIDKDNPIVNWTAEFLVQHINEIVRPFRQCSELLLDAVKDVQLQVPREHLNKDIKDSGVHDYLLVVRTIPGNAVFEGTVRHRPNKEKLSVAGFVSRLNLYGSQSACVHNYHLKLYCYCSS